MPQKKTFHTHPVPLSEDEEPEKEEVPEWAANLTIKSPVVLPQTPPTTRAPASQPVSRSWQKIPVPASVMAVFFIIFVFSVSAFAWAFYSYKTVSAKTTKQPGLNINSGQSQEQQQQKKTELLAKVSKLIILPANADPIIATIIDAEQLKKEQVFYANAKNGDIVLVYPEAKKAFIYNPKQNIIVNVGPVIAEKNTPVIPSPTSPVIPNDTSLSSRASLSDEGSIPIKKTSSTISSSTQKLTVEIRNGTNVAGLGVKLSWALKSEDFFVEKISNAIKNYPNTIIVNLSKKSKSALVKKLEDQFKVKAVTKIPPEETSSTAQVLIFIGTDYANQI